jgi:hypothetical protein
LLLRAARFELNRRAATLPHLRGGDPDDLAQQSADDALLLGPAEPEVTCEQCFDALDRYVELGLAGVDAEAAVPGLRAHLHGCPACNEDHDSLLAYLEEQAK